MYTVVVGSDSLSNKRATGKFNDKNRDEGQLTNAQALVNSSAASTFAYRFTGLEISADAAGDHGTLQYHVLWALSGMTVRLSSSTHVRWPRGPHQSLWNETSRRGRPGGRETGQTDFSGAKKNVSANR